VLCPPHLVDQWVAELTTKFEIHAVAVTSASASRLERDLPPSERIFDVHPFTVVSLDYVKSERRRHDFLRACPDFVMVDEAHACTGTGRGMQQRYRLLSGLAQRAERHMVFLTATPHSGDADAFSASSA
jgi:superfamily II DNA or RNA helicase